MAKLLRKVRQVLEQNLRNFCSGLEEEPTGRVMGFVVSGDFHGRSHEKRQARLRSILNKALTESELLSVGPIVTLTPQEVESTREIESGIHVPRKEATRHAT